MPDDLATPPCDGLHLLAVDDDPAIRLLLEANFTRRGARVSLAENAHRALELAETHRFDAVLVDLMLPGMSGLELLPLLRAALPDAPVVVLTAHGSVDAAVQALHAGAWTFLQKPFRAPHLVRTIAQAVEAFRTRKELSAAERRADSAEQLLRALQRERELEKQLVSHYRMASLGVLAAGVAHEINNPMAFVQANLETLARHTPLLESVLRREILEHSAGPSADAIGEALEDLRPCVAESIEGTRRVLEIVSAVRRSARPSDGVRQESDLAEVARAAAVLARNRFMGSLKLVSELAPTFTVCDASRVTQVVLNLLANAADVLGDRGGTAWLRTGTSFDRPWIEVADSGSGVSPEQMPLLFQRFFTTKGQRGTGLGLALSREIVEEHGGSLVVASRREGGAVFRLEFPATPLVPDELLARAARGDVARPHL